MTKKKINNDGAMRAVIYARYSSESQREESIEGQLRECYAFARNRYDSTNYKAVLKDGIWEQLGRMPLRDGAPLEDGIAVANIHGRKPLHNPHGKFDRRSMGLRFRFCAVM